MLLLGTLATVSIYSSHVAAASYTWDGGGTTSNWSDCDNWSSNICPTAADTVTFNATSTKASTVDAAWTGTVTSVTIAAGYSGTLSLERSLTLSGTFSQNTGVFDSGMHDLTIGTFSLVNGVFTASSGNFTVSSVFSIGGGTFNHNNGTVIITGMGNTISCNNAIFNLVVFQNAGTKTVSAGCTLPLGNDPVLSTSGALTLNGNLTGTGTLTKTSSTINLNTTGTITGFSSLTINSLAVNGAAADWTNLSQLTVNGAFTLGSGSLVAPSSVDFNSTFTLSSGSTFTAPSGVMSVAGGFTVNSGATFNANGGTVHFDAGPATIACNNATFHLVSFANHTAGTKTVSDGCILPLGSNPTMRSVTLSGTLSGSGAINTLVNLTLNATAVLDGFTGLSVAGVFTNAGAEVDMGDYTTADFNGAFVLSSGTFTAPSGTMTAASTFTINSGATFNHNNGTVVFDGGTATLSCNDADFNYVILQNAATKTVSSSCHLPLGTNPIMSASVNLSGTLAGSGTLGATSGTLTINSTGVLTGFSGVDLRAVTLTEGILDLSDYDPVYINSTFILNPGSVFTAPTGEMTAGGNFTTFADTVFDANGGVLNFGGTTNGNGTIACYDTVFNEVNFTHTAGTKTVGQTCNFFLGNDHHLARGGTVAVSGTLTGSGTLYVEGGMTMNAGGVLSGFTGIITTKNLTASGTTLDLDPYSPVIVGGDLLSTASGTIIAPSGNLEVGGAVRKNSDSLFYHNFGTITLTGGNQAISGVPEITLYNLTKVTAEPSNLTFLSSRTVTIEGQLTLRGDNGVLSLVSSIPGQPWLIHTADQNTLQHLYIQDSYNTGVLPLVAQNSTDGGNNTNWVLGISTDTPSDDTTSTLADSGTSLIPHFLVGITILILTSTTRMRRRVYRVR